MKVISWNMWVKNLDPIGNLKKLIAAESPDIICLQEVKINVLEFVHDGLFEGYDYIYGFDFRKHKGGFYENYYLVTLSKKKILNQKVNKIHVNHKTQWSLWDTLMRWDESIEFLYADIELGHKKLRIFNCHMELSAGPRLRLEQFDLILKKFVEGSKNIVCGDF
ncbi:MAG: hypothetical protein HC932_00750 [Thermales bacterium]|nr:hypothetical protein [Thermales bacterium]